MRQAHDARAHKEPVGPVSSRLPFEAVFQKMLEEYAPLHQLGSDPAYVFHKALALPVGVFKITQGNVSRLGNMVKGPEPHLESKGPCAAVPRAGTRCRPLSQCPPYI